MAAGRAANLNSSLLDRLLLTPERIKGIAGGARQVSELPDPLGNTLRKSTLPNGIELEQSLFRSESSEWFTRLVPM